MMKHFLKKSWSEEKFAVLVFLILSLLPVFISGYIIYILPQYMLYGTLAMSLGLLWGFTGILSFGQAGFFALGAYTMGLCMKYNGFGINPAYAGIILSAFMGAGLATIIGYFLFSAGVRDAYFVIVTLALSIIVEQIAVSQSDITGGWNGFFIDRMSLTLGSGREISLFNDVPMYYFVLPLVAFVYFLLRKLITSKFGKVLIGIRENEDRAISLGFNTSLYKTAAFAISGAVATWAGALYGTHAGFVAPSLGGVSFSTEVVVWTALGGRTSLLGVFLGGVMVASLSNYLSAITPRFWQLVLGILFVTTIIYFKGGVAGALTQFTLFNRKTPLKSIQEVRAEQAMRVD
ncbi:MAG TPA: branched-chain amino acid ABC transporter permease [Candidatus Limnocylindrales bacterium]|nr:branched-chain amino acid ABC transporter permease [Candidatus Limnocylindrales bacterium]